MLHFFKPVQDDVDLRRGTFLGTRRLTLSKPVQRPLTLRPAPSRRYQFVTRLIRDFNHFVTPIVARLERSLAEALPIGQEPPWQADANTGHSHAPDAEATEYRFEIR